MGLVIPQDIPPLNVKNWTNLWIRYSGSLYGFFHALKVQFVSVRKFKYLFWVAPLQVVIGASSACTQMWGCNKQSIWPLALWNISIVPSWILCFGATLSHLCSQDSHLVGRWVPYGVLGVKPVSTTSKISSLPLLDKSWPYPLWVFDQIALYSLKKISFSLKKRLSSI